MHFIQRFIDWVFHVVCYCSILVAWLMNLKPCRSSTNRNSHSVAVLLGVYTYHSYQKNVQRPNTQIKRTADWASCSFFSHENTNTWKYFIIINKIFINILLFLSLLFFILFLLKFLWLLIILLLSLFFLLFSVEFPFFTKGEYSIQ